MIEAVLFDGDQTLWDFQRVMRDALVAVLGELQAARPGPFTGSLRWQDLERDRAAVGMELEGVEYNLARLRVLGFARTLGRLREAEGGGDEAADAALAGVLSASYFHHRDRDPALFPDTLPCLDALQARYRLGLLSNGSRLPEKVGLARYFESRRVRPGPSSGQAGQGHLRGGGAPARGGAQGLCPRGRPPPQRRGRGQARRLERRVDRPRRLRRAVTPTGEHPDAVVRSLDELPDALDRLGGG